MSKFNSYARRVNEVAKKAFDEYRKAEKAYQDAHAKAVEYPQRIGIVDAEYAAKSARAHADYLEAKEALSKATRALKGHNSDIAAIKTELAAALDKEYAADPTKLDTATMELLKSGILNAYEYNKLLEDAKAAGNHTMVRIIANAAKTAAEEEGRRHGEESEGARALRAISYTNLSDTRSVCLNNFDVLAEAYKRTSDNTAMMNHWDELTGEIIAEF